jgi:glycosyltransferase involved in cell wall biosynthesis
MDAQMTPLSSLSVVLPCFNEAGNIEPLVRRFMEVLPPVAAKWEIIVVDDGSSDGTGPLADRLAAELPGVRAVHHPVNRGYGAAVRSGFAAARHGHVFLTDGDGQFDPGEITLLIPLAESADIVAGYRIKRCDPLHRSVNATLYHLLIALLFGLRHRDIDCAFKLISRKVLESVALTSDGALISAELLIRAKRAGFGIAQTGVHHYPRVAGAQTGAKLSVIIRMFREVVRFRWEQNGRR